MTKMKMVMNKNKNKIINYRRYNHKLIKSNHKKIIMEIVIKTKMMMINKINLHQEFVAKTKTQIENNDINSEWATYNTYGISRRKKNKPKKYHKILDKLPK
jgi:hypothetical protein